MVGRGRVRNFSAQRGHVAFDAVIPLRLPGSQRQRTGSVAGVAVEATGPEIVDLPGSFRLAMRIVARDADQFTLAGAEAKAGKHLLDLADRLDPWSPPGSPD